MRLDCRTTPLQIHHSCNDLRILAFLVGPMAQLVDHLEGQMEDHSVDQMGGRLVDLKADHLEGRMEGR